MYGKQTERAIGALSRLAEVWDGGTTRLSALQIAEERGLPAPMVAKILSTLSQAGIVAGSPGPGGGYALARPPAEISLKQVHILFERENHSYLCPFGGGVCGVGDPCAIHDSLVAMQADITRFLESTTLEIFRVAAQDQGLKPTEQMVQLTTPRESYRAPDRGRN
ncbi:MAG: Rrf2 family transcriptional regulator [Phycisphaerae bacterium]|nr:Rrf2 family transcriptional regulator [Phycisphaerae bacterium]